MLAKVLNKVGDVQKIGLHEDTFSRTMGNMVGRVFSFTESTDCPGRFRAEGIQYFWHPSWLQLVSKETVKTEAEREARHTVFRDRRVFIKVVITKTHKFQAQVCELFKDGKKIKYEVTVGGKEWFKGKGRRYEAIIKDRMKGLLTKLEDQLKIVGEVL
jgi:hypothetical protein